MHASTDNTRVKVESAFFHNYPLITVLPLLQYIPVPTMAGISSAPIPFLRLDLLILNVFVKVLLNLRLELCVGYSPSSAQLESLLGSQDTSPLSPFSDHCEKRQESNTKHA